MSLFPGTKPETRSGSRSSLSWALHSRLSVLPQLCLFLQPPFQELQRPFLSWKNKSSSVFVCSFTLACSFYIHRRAAHTCRATDDALLRLLNHLNKRKSFNVWLEIHEWKGQTGNTANMCLSFFQSIRVAFKQIFTELLF